MTATDLRFALRRLLRQGSVSVAAALTLRSGWAPWPRSSA